MYRTYQLTEEEKANKHFTSFWDGDTTVYTVYENEEEYQQEKTRLQKIEEEYKKQKERWLNS